MLFCGQCGLHLAPGTVRCPRCGALAENPVEGAEVEFRADDPTVTSLSYTYGQLPYSDAPTPAPPLTTTNPPGPFYPENVSPESASFPRQYPAQPAAPSRSRGRILFPFIILLGVLLIFGAIFLFVRQYDTSSSEKSGNPGNASSSSPTAQASTLIQQYYTDVNNKDYPGAYSLWKSSPHRVSLQRFEAGYANTQHDALTIGNVVQLGNGTVQVNVTVVATEKVSTSTRQSTYRGYYIVEHLGGIWKIIGGNLSRA